MKAYGDCPLQLSTDSRQRMFPYLEKHGLQIKNPKQIASIFKAEEFSDFGTINVMPLIYNEISQRCNIMIFNHKKAMNNTKKIVYVDTKKKFDSTTGKIVPGKGRTHPIFMFVDSKNNYICEVRYGGASANALQRGLWTNTKNAVDYFDSLTNGWIDYSHNHTLVKLFSLALNSSEKGHKLANEILQKDIDQLKQL
ncbi:MAG: hypothetical protein HZC05_00085 [Candidatus Magasanikbacteria bacterium]|nr:hypothetical protein [Candidatus Magasanikbacteria bacterium]